MKRNLVSQTILIPTIVCGAMLSVVAMGSCASLSNYNAIDISNVQKSPYNWYQHTVNGHKTYSTYPGGAYLSFEFEGSTVGLNGWCSSSFGSRILLNCYIDDSTTPIQKKWSDALGNILIFTNKLNDLENHKAFIVVSSIGNNNDHIRWEWPDSLNILNVLLEKGKDVIVPNLDGIPPKKVLIYGDSITEANTAGAENQTFAGLCRNLGYEYGQIGWIDQKISEQTSQAPEFYIKNDPINNPDSGWNNYRGADVDGNSYSRLTTTSGVPSYLDGNPDFIINNIGVNDSVNIEDPTKAVDIYRSWVTQLMGNGQGELDLKDSSTMLFLVMPYRFGKINQGEHYKKWHYAFQQMFADMHGIYQNNVFVVDLQTIADIVIEYSSYDNWHPNKRGYELLGDLLEKYALQPRQPVNVAFNDTSEELSWEADERATTYSIIPGTTSFQVQCAEIIDGVQQDWVPVGGSQPYQNDELSLNELSNGQYVARVVAINNLSKNEAASSPTSPFEISS